MCEAFKLFRETRKDSRPGRYGDIGGERGRPTIHDVKAFLMGPGPWTGEPTAQPYTFRVVGAKVGGTRFSVDCIEASGPMPHMRRRDNTEVLRIIKAKLGEVTGLRVSAFPMSIVLWSDGLIGPFDTEKQHDEALEEQKSPQMISENTGVRLSVPAVA